MSYVGTHGNAHDLWTVLESASQMKSIAARVLFLFAGGGAEADALRAHASANGLTNVRFLGQIERLQIPSLRRASDICLATLRDSPVFRTAVPTKIYEYMAAGKPVLSNVAGEAEALVRTSGSGLTVAPGDPGALTTGILRLMQDPELCTRMGEAGQKYVSETAS